MQTSLATFLVLALFGLSACIATPVPSPGLTPSPGATPSPVATASPSPSPPPATQEAILGAVAAWVGREHTRDGFLYVSQPLVPMEWVFEPEDDPVLRNAGPPQFGSELSEATRSEISAALADKEVEFVADREAIVDPEGFEHFGCRPHLFGRSLVLLTAPRPLLGENGFLVGINLDRGCQGDIYLVEVGQTSSGYEVIRVVRQGSWIV